MAPNENAYRFLPPAPSNTSRLQSALHGSKRKAEVASARRKSPDDDSALPRLLVAVYTPLLRCATASDACNLAAGYGLSKRGAASVPRFAFLIRFAYALETFFLRSAHRFFIKSDNRLLPAGVRVTLPFAAGSSMRNSTRPCGGFWCLSVQCCYGSTESVSFPFQFRYDSSCIQGALLWLAAVQDFESPSVDT